MKKRKKKSNKNGYVLRNAKQRRELKKKFSKSGKTRAAFCRDYGINPNTFSGWLRNKKPVFTEVVMSDQAVSGIEIELSEKIKIHVPIRRMSEVAELVKLVNKGGVRC